MCVTIILYYSFGGVCLVGGVAYYKDEEIDKLSEKPFKRHVITEYNNKKFGIGYYRFAYINADKFPEFDYFCWGNFAFHRSDGKTSFQGLCKYPPLLTYFSYKRCYKNIQHYKEKYKNIENDIVVNCKTKKFGMERLRYCNNKKAFTLPFALYSPDVIHNEKYPLVIYLHGKGHGSENNRCAISHAKHIIKKCKSNIEKNPCFILVPSLPEYEIFSGYPKDRENSDINPFFDGIFSELFETLCSRNPIDKNRIYIIGNSEGGGGVWTQLNLHPERYAAGIPMMGFTHNDTPGFYDSIKDIPVWAVHAANDTNVAIGRKNGSCGSDVIVKGIKSFGGSKIKYSRYNKFGHGVSDVFIRNEDWHTWLFSQRKNPYIK